MQDSDYVPLYIYILCISEGILLKFSGSLPHTKKKNGVISLGTPTVFVIV